MDFQLEYKGTEDNLAGTLMCDGVVVESAGGFKSRDSVAKWADKTARDYKVAHTPEATHEHQITGKKTFTL